MLLVVPLTALGGYLLGSVPTGYLVAKTRGVDIRTVGSGNIGATNVLRSLGKPLGAVVLAVDGLKGFAAVTWLADPLGNQWLPASAGEGAHELVVLAAGLAAILGHNYTCWLGFKGGKGIATSAGVLLALMPRAFLIVLGLWIGVFSLCRYVSLASLSAAVALPFAAWFTTGQPLLIAATAGMSGLAIYKHRTNIRRLLAGTEHRFGATQPTDPPSHT